MQLKQHQFALAAAEAVGIAYAACAILVVLLPATTTKFFSYLFHAVNLDTIIDANALTFGGVLFGLIEALVYTYLFVYLFAWLYNRSVK